MIFRILAVIASLLGAAIAAKAEEQEIPQACHGRNLLEDLRASDPAGAAAIRKEADATPNAGPLLWKITPKNHGKPSFLMGTMHTTDTRVATLSDALKAKIAASRVTALELKEILDKKALQGRMMADTARTQMPKGQTLWDAIPDGKEDLIRRQPMLAMMPPQLLERFQPWVVSTQLASPLCEQLRGQFKVTLDEAIARQAQASGVEVVGLETLEEQLAVLSGMPIRDQAEMLVQQASLKMPAEDTFQTTVDLYLAHDVSATMPLFKYLSAKSGVPMDAKGDAFMKELIDKRNVIMANRAAPLIDKGQAFIAVGALHLPGKAGVIELLRKMGYRVETAE